MRTIPTTPTGASCRTTGTSREGGWGTSKKGGADALRTSGYLLPYEALVLIRGIFRAPDLRERVIRGAPFPEMHYAGPIRPSRFEVSPMEMIKLGKRGQVSIPRSVLSRLGLEGEIPLLVEITEDGAILLRPAGVYPIELYSKERIEEFDAADRMDEATADRLSRVLDTAK